MLDGLFLFFSLVLKCVKKKDSTLYHYFVNATAYIVTVKDYFLQLDFIFNFRVLCALGMMKYNTKNVQSKQTATMLLLSKRGGTLRKKE